MEERPEVSLPQGERMGCNGSMSVTEKYGSTEVEGQTRARGNSAHQLVLPRLHVCTFLCVYTCICIYSKINNSRYHSAAF